MMAVPPPAHSDAHLTAYILNTLPHKKFTLECTKVPFHSLLKPLLSL